MGLVEIQADRIVPIEETTFSALSMKERGDLQRLLRDRIEVIDPDLLVISEEFSNWEDSSRRIDLLCLDRDKNLVIVEIKRDADGGHMELQAIRYAAMVHQMTLEHVVAAFDRYRASRGIAGDARAAVLAHLGCSDLAEAVLTTRPRIILLSQDFNSEITTTVLWLRDEFELDVSCVRITPHKLGDRVLANIEQIIPLPEARQFMMRQREKTAETRRAERNEDSPYWFFNVGMHDENWRDWDHCRRLGFLSAGGGIKYSAPLTKLRNGDPVFAYQKDMGYVGYGVVETERLPLDQIPLGEDRSRLATLLPIVSNQINQSSPDTAEYAVGIRWLKTFELDDARWEKGLFANQWTACRLTHAPTIAFLEREFEVAETAARQPQ